MLYELLPVVRELLLLRVQKVSSALSPAWPNVAGAFCGDKKLI